jgi:hypothetical protein
MSEPAERTDRDVPAMVIGVVEMASGVPSAAYVLATGWTTSVVKSASFVRVESNLAALSMMVALLFGATAFAGWRLCRGSRLGYGLSAALIAAQAIRVVVPGFQFDVYCPLSLGFGWILDGAGAGPAMVTGYGLSFWIGWAPTVPEPCVSINAIALFAVLYLLVRMGRVVGGGGVAIAQPGGEPNGPSPGLTP